MTDPAAQAHMNMQLAVAVGKGVQLDAAQTAGIFALLWDQQREIEELRDRLRTERAAERDAVVAHLLHLEDFEIDMAYGRAAYDIEHGEHLKEKP